MPTAARAPRTALAVGLVALLALTGCADDPPGSAAPTVAAPTVPASPAGTPSGTAPSSAGEPLGVRVLASGLTVPWGLAFLPGGDGLVSERGGRVVRVPAAGGTPTEVRRVAGTRAEGEGGLLGLAVRPGSDPDPLVYAYVTTAQDNRIVRFRLSGGPQEDVLTGIPRGRIHNGGRLAFGPDGLLYAGTGDVGDRSLSQDPGSLGGKVLRLTPDGDPVGGSHVFTRGHRNVQGLAFDATGRLWATEFGQNTFDEVNVLRAGGNYGWPDVEGVGRRSGFVDPVVTWTTDEASPSGAAVVDDALWVAALRGTRLWRVPLDQPGARTARYEGEFGRLRTVGVAPDGALWALTSNRDGRGDPVDADDRVLRIPRAATRP